MSSDAPVPFRSNSRHFDILKSGIREPLFHSLLKTFDGLGNDFDVFLFFGKKHPDIGKETREPEGWMDGTYDTGDAVRPNHSVGFTNASLRLWPILDTPCTDVTIESIGLYWNVFSISLQTAHIKSALQIIPSNLNTSHSLERLKKIV